MFHLNNNLTKKNIRSSHYMVYFRHFCAKLLILLLVLKMLKPKKYVEIAQVTNYLDQEKKEQKIKIYALTGRDFR